MEKDLFEPIKNYFEGFGYVCDGEVHDIDLYMEKETSSVAVELKNTLDFKAIQQAALRQKVTDTVFIGIFKPRDLFSRSFKDKLYLLKRLGIGLIVYSPQLGSVEIISEPIVSELSNFKKRNQNKKKALSQEFQKRTLKSNTGGVHQTRLITSYREDALRVLDALSKLGGSSTTRKINKLSGVGKSTQILYHNYYDWFQPVERGSYCLTSKGQKALNEYRNEINALLEAEHSSN